MKPLAAALILLIACAVSAEEKKPTDALQGEWKVVSLTVTTMDVPKDETDKMKAAVKDDTLTLTFKTDKSLDITMKLDPKAKPAKIDLTWSEGGKEVSVPGIYKIEKDTLTICYEHNVVGKRPKEFKSEDGGRTVLIVLERAKK
jgi:uncharacterized protein (TIGR03067 family)